MFIECLPLLTKEQKLALRNAGITRFLLGDWRASRRIPTLAQVAVYAAITGIDKEPLIEEITMRRATPVQRAILKKARV